MDGINGSGLGHLRRALCWVVSTVGLLVMSESAPWIRAGGFDAATKYKGSGVKSRLVQTPGLGFFSKSIVAEPILVTDILMIKFMTCSSRHLTLEHPLGQTAGGRSLLGAGHLDPLFSLRSPCHDATKLGIDETKQETGPKREERKTLEVTCIFFGTHNDGRNCNCETTRRRDLENNAAGSARRTQSSEPRNCRRLRAGDRSAQGGQGSEKRYGGVLDSTSGFQKS
ncbi:uncharacterized protein B0H64DRAFT_74460 [Chaetomium fimeti]|uniref:Uncharacterized protein n=1 Tax=Chaetomium fimeti TaxID=1854472 RepID=A0AAE0HKS9_9PEZI|nr:hypothetical protein B0H64DRAFT_74460 [Chaetomium fimeti]